jgi:hypothetical protein
MANPTCKECGANVDVTPDERTATAQRATTYAARCSRVYLNDS